MQIVNSNQLAEETWTLPQGKYGGASRAIPEALGRQPQATDLLERHPFDVEILRVAPGQTPYPPVMGGPLAGEAAHPIRAAGVLRRRGGAFP